jgi:hypothetical protein
LELKLVRTLRLEEAQEAWGKLLEVEEEDKATLTVLVNF